jgi:hypothetical protein
VVCFGYLINEIGFNLSVMRKSEENLTKNLRTLNRIERFYSVDRGLVNKAKGYLINNENFVDQLTPSEENGLLQKLNE